MPNAGVYVEHGGHDIKAGVINKQTGGYAAYVNLGIEVYFDRFSLGASYRHAVFQSLSEGELRAKDQFSTHITFLF